MATERQPVEGPYPAWPPPYERSAWLDVDDKTIQVEGDPETREGFAAAYDFLHVVTVYFKNEYGSVSSPTQRGLWWTVTVEEIKDELEHRNQWAQWDARRRQQTDETSHSYRSYTGTDTRSLLSAFVGFTEYRWRRSARISALSPCA